MGLSSAVNSARPGDLYWLTEGTYNVNTLSIGVSGTAQNPTVFRAAVGERATIVGNIVVSGSNIWIWGLEITDPNRGAPNSSAASGGIGMSGSASNVRLINNIIHDSWDCGIGGWNTGPGHIYYGNIVYRVGNHSDPSKRCYPIYTQNRFISNGHKYIIDNQFLDAAPDIGGPGYNFHGYTENNYVSGLYLEGNIISNGQFLIGGFGNEPNDRNVIRKNYFYKSDPRLGYRREAQAEFSGNYLGRSGLYIPFFWGAGDVRGLQRAPMIITNNEIYNGRHVEYTTSIVTTNNSTVPPSLTRVIGIAPLNSSDVVDNNTYSSPFSSFLFAQGKSGSYSSLASWRSDTQTAGNRFDGNSSLVAFPNTARIFIIPNMYEPGRGHAAVFNWGLLNSVNIDISGAVSPGRSYKILNSKNPFGMPLASGIYNGGSVSISLGGAEFMPLLIISNDSGQVSADFNKDGIVNSLDFSFISARWNQTANISPYDLNKDGIINSIDVSILLSRWLKSGV
jgi:hypothetical protein